MLTRQSTVKAHPVARLIVVRTVPRSRHNPQFDRDTLPVALAVNGIGYEQMAAWEDSPP